MHRSCNKTGFYQLELHSHTFFELQEEDFYLAFTNDNDANDNKLIKENDFSS